MSEQPKEEQESVQVILTLTEDGDVDVSASSAAMDMALITYVVGLAQYKLHMSHFGMVYRQLDEKRKEEQKSKPRLLLPK